MIMLDTSNEKPPLGAKPYFISIPERISELAHAIDNYSSSGSPLIEVWAKEIILQTKILNKLKAGDQKGVAEETTI